MASVKRRIYLAKSTLVKSEGVHVELAFSFSDFSYNDNFTVLDMDSPYALILGMTWLVKHRL